MTCREVQSRLSAWQDGELTEAAAGPLRAHLAQCPDCRSEAEAGAALLARLKVLPPPQVGHGFASAVLHRVVVPAPRRRLVPAMGYALLFLLCFFVGFAATHPRLSPTTTTAAVEVVPVSITGQFQENQELSLREVQDECLALLGGGGERS